MAPRHTARLNRARGRVGQQAIKVEGLTSLNRLLKHADAGLREELRSELSTAVEPIRSAAVRNIRAGTHGKGELASKVRVRVFIGRYGVVAKIGVSRLIKAPVREFARRRTLRIAGRAPAIQTLKPGRFLMRAIEQNKHTVGPQVQEIVTRFLERIFRQAGVR